MAEQLEPPRYPDERPRAATVRSRLMLEVASALVGQAGWPHKQVRIDMREQGAASWGTALFASDGLDSVDDVLTGRAQFAVINPATAVRPALRRIRSAADGALAAIATIPSYDQLGFAVARSAGVATLADLPDVHPSLQVSLRGNRPNHSVHMAIEDTLAAVGVSLADFRAWGGRVRYDDGLPHGTLRSTALRDGVIDAVFDEGVYNWVDMAAAAGTRLLAVPDDALGRLEAMGYRSGVLRKERYPSLDADVITVDFSGFLVFTRSDSPEALVGSFCDALVASHDRIPWQGGSALPLDRMCVDAVDAPIPLPLHPAARSVWERHGLVH